MKPGDQLDRYALGAKVASRDGVDRFRAVATDTGEPVEILVLATGDGRARAEFVDRHAALAGLRDPALVPTLAARPAGSFPGQDRPIAVRGPLEDAALDAVATPLDSATVAWIGARLVPAVLAAGPATRGALRTSDIGLDTRGHPVLAPRIEPMTRVALGSTRSVAPEAFDGHPPDAAAGLYGLGVVLYELATGQPPATVGTRAARPPPPPPSALRHGIPPAFDAAVLRLLAADPGVRVGALPMLQDLAGPPVDLRPRVRAAPALAPVRTTRAQGLGGDSPIDAARTEPARLPPPGGLAVVPATALAGLDPAARSHAAGIAGIPLEVVETLVEQRLPLVLASTSGRSAAAERARALATSSGLPVTATTPGAIPGWLVAAGGAAVALVPALVALVLLLVGWVPGAAGAGIAALVVLLVGLGAGWRVERGRSTFTEGTTALARARDALTTRTAGGLLAPTWDHLARLRLEIARTGELPSAAAADLRGALKDIEARLSTLAQVAETADRTLRQVDLPALRTKLGTLNAQATADPQRRSERDRLARTVADLEVVEGSRGTIVPEANRILAALREISAVLAQLAVDEDAALARLDRAARRARDAATPMPVAPLRDGARPAVVEDAVEVPAVEVEDAVDVPPVEDAVEVPPIEDAVEVLANEDTVADPVADTVADGALAEPVAGTEPAVVRPPAPPELER